MSAPAADPVAACGAECPHGRHCTLPAGHKERHEVWEIFSGKPAKSCDWPRRTQGGPQ